MTFNPKSTIDSAELVAGRNPKSKDPEPCTLNFGLVGFFFGIIIWIEFFSTFRADSVAEGGIRMFTNIAFDLVPVTFIIPDLFA